MDLETICIKFAQVRHLDLITILPSSVQYCQLPRIKMLSL